MKVKWNGGWLLDHYIFFAVPFLFWLLAFFLAVKDDHLGDDQILLSIALGITVFNLWVINHNDKLIKISLKGDLSGLRENLKFKLKEEGWNSSTNNSQYISAFKKGIIQPLGVRMVILFHQDTVYINVQNAEGYKGYFPFSFGRNGRIRSKWAQIIANYCQSKDKQI